VLKSDSLSHYSLPFIFARGLIKEVQSLIAEDVSAKMPENSATRYTGQIVINNVTIEYRAFLRNGNTINVGTYFPVVGE